MKNASVIALFAALSLPAWAAGTQGAKAERPHDIVSAVSFLMKKPVMKKALSPFGFILKKGLVDPTKFIARNWRSGARIGGMTAATVFAGPVGGSMAAVGMSFLDQPAMKNVGFYAQATSQAPAVRSESGLNVPSADEVAEAGRKPYLRYTVSPNMQWITTSIFNQARYDKDRDGIAKLPRRTARQLGLSGRDFYNEWGEDVAVEATLSDNAILLLDPRSGEPIYLADCMWNGKPWVNRIQILNEPASQVVPTAPAVNPVQPQTIVQVPQQAPPVVNMNMPGIPTPIQLNVAGLPNYPTYPSEMTIRVIHEEKETIADKIRKGGVGIGVGLVGYGAAHASHSIPGAWKDTARTKVAGAERVEMIKADSSKAVANINAEAIRYQSDTGANALVQSTQISSSGSQEQERIRGTWNQNVANINKDAASQTATIVGKATVDAAQELRAGTENAAVTAANATTQSATTTANATIEAAKVTGSHVVEAAKNMPVTNISVSSTSMAEGGAGGVGGSPTVSVIGPTVTAEANNQGVSAEGGTGGNAVANGGEGGKAIANPVVTANGGEGGKAINEGVNVTANPVANGGIANANNQGVKSISQGGVATNSGVNVTANGGDSSSTSNATGGKAVSNSESSSNSESKATGGNATGGSAQANNGGQTTKVGVNNNVVNKPVTNTTNNNGNTIGVENGNTIVNKPEMNQNTKVGGQQTTVVNKPVNNNGNSIETNVSQSNEQKTSNLNKNENGNSISNTNTQKQEQDQQDSGGNKQPHNKH